MAISHLMRLMKYSVAGGLGNTRSSSILLKNYASLPALDSTTPYSLRFSDTPNTTLPLFPSSRPFSSLVDVSPVMNSGIVIVPETKCFIVERFGAYSKTLDAGLHFLIPFVDRISHVVYMQEKTVHMHTDSITTKDNITVMIHGAVYVQLKNPKLAAYSVPNLEFVLVSLAQASFRSEIERYNYNECFQELDSINLKVMKSVNAVIQEWGVEVIKKEIIAINDGMVNPASAVINERAHIIAPPAAPAAGAASGRKRLNLKRVILRWILKILRLILIGYPLGIFRGHEKGKKYWEKKN